MGLPDWCFLSRLILHDRDAAPHYEQLVIKKIKFIDSSMQCTGVQEKAPRNLGSFRFHDGDLFISGRILRRAASILLGSDWMIATVFRDHRWHELSATETIRSLYDLYENCTRPTKMEGRLLGKS